LGRSSFVVLAALPVVAACSENAEDDSPLVCSPGPACGARASEPPCTGSYDERYAWLESRCESPSLLLSTYTCEQSGLKAVRDTWPYAGSMSYYDATGALVGYVSITDTGKETCNAMAPAFQVPTDCKATKTGICYALP
jgi:hypothetical protein